jgi:hypothetical protein
MRVPLWVREAAASFWEAVGVTAPFPRSLRSALARGPFEVAIKELPGLSVRAVAGYLAGLGVAWSWGGPERRLRACLAAWQEAGLVLLDADDPLEERAFSLAHELAHFLRDYWLPRRKAAAALGEGVLDVFNGQRPPRSQERLRGLLGGTPIGPHLHLMARDGNLRSAAIAAAERDANRLAYELLAPASEVFDRLPAGATAKEAAALLRAGFCLPEVEAANYAAILFPLTPPPDPLAARLKKARAARRTSARTGEQKEEGDTDEPRA